jgi:hypothetical protein
MHAITQVCSGLQVLIAGAESRRIPAELQALSSTSTKFLPALFGLADRGTDTALPEDKVKKVLRIIFKNFLQELFICRFYTVPIAVYKQCSSV